MIDAYVWCGLGFLVSLYGLIVKRKREANSKYRALCDFNDKFSCSTVLTSKESALIGVPNSYGGLIFYPLMAVLFYLNFITIAMWGALVSVVASTYLGYLQFFEIKKVCMVCNTIYVINIALLILSL